MNGDPLAAARGCFYGLILGAASWLIITLAVLAVVLWITLGAVIGTWER